MWFCRFQLSLFATPTKIGTQVTAVKYVSRAIKHVSRACKRKSIITQNRCLIRLALSTAHSLWRSGRVNMYKTSRLQMACLTCGEITSRDERCGTYRKQSHSNATGTATNLATMTYFMKTKACPILPGVWCAINASRKCASRAQHDLWSSLWVSPNSVCRRGFSLGLPN